MNNQCTHTPSALSGAPERLQLCCSQGAKDRLTRQGLYSWLVSLQHIKVQMHVQLQLSRTVRDCMLGFQVHHSCFRS